MLHDKIEAARRSFLQTWGTIVVASAGGFVAAIVLGWFLVGDRIAGKPASVPAPLPAPAVGSSSPPAPVATPSPTVAPAPAPSPAPAPAPTSVEPAESAERETFKAELKTYEAEIEPVASSEAFRRWNENAVTAINGAKSAAMTAFHLGRYKDALAALREARRQAELQIADREKAVRSAVERAEKALAQDKADEARLHLAELQRIDPSHPGLARTAVQLERLPALLEALGAADVARAEKRPARELEELRKALALAPERTGLKQRVDELAGQIAEENFRLAIAQGGANLDRGDIPAAQKALASARAIHPGRSEVSQLAARIAGLERSRRLDALSAAAQAAVAEDDWAQALTLFQEAAKIEPAKMAPQIDQAKAVLAARADLAGFLRQPQRLTAPSVVAQAEAALKNAASHAAASPGLARSAKELKDTIALYGREIAVRITSDNQTHILVRGVGQVGLVQDKTIRLRPGEYLIEGSRAGYKSKLVRTVIAPTAESITLQIICDEPV